MNTDWNLFAIHGCHIRKVCAAANKPILKRVFSERVVNVACVFKFYKTKNNDFARICVRGGEGERIIFRT